MGKQGGDYQGGGRDRATEHNLSVQGQATEIRAERAERIRCKGYSIQMTMEAHGNDLGFVANEVAGHLGDKQMGMELVQPLFETPLHREELQITRHTAVSSGLT